jgi:predicted nucleotidyltransferase
METLDAKPSGRAIHPCVIELREMLQSVLGDNFVRLYHYGSRVEGGAEPDSDYDVLCVTKRPLSRQQRDDVLDRQIDLQLAHDVFFDLHFYTDEELHTPPISFTPYVQHVTADGVEV